MFMSNRPWLLQTNCQVDSASFGAKRGLFIKDFDIFRVAYLTLMVGYMSSSDSIGVTLLRVISYPISVTVIYVYLCRCRRWPKTATRRVCSWPRTCRRLRRWAGRPSAGPTRWPSASPARPSAGPRSSCGHLLYPRQWNDFRIEKRNTISQDENAMPIKYHIHRLSMRKIGISIFISPDLPLKSIYIYSLVMPRSIRDTSW